MRGGAASNVIPETVEFVGTFRFVNSESYSYLKQRIKEVFYHILDCVVVLETWSVEEVFDAEQ